MNKSVWKQLVTAIHSSGRQSVIAITGGGSQAIGKLLSVPGGAQTLLEAVVPYSIAALTNFLGSAPDQACSEPTARTMAMAAWKRAKHLGADSRTIVGIGATASLASSAPKRGEHRIYIAVQTAEETSSISLKLAKGKRTRQQEERLAAKLLLLAFGDVCAADTDACRTGFDSKLLADEQIQRQHQQAPLEWTKLLLGEQKLVDWPLEASKELPSIIFPGAFNPLHQGHRRMAEVAVERTKGTLCYELSITNVDKPPLDFVEIAQRLAAIEKNDPGQRVLLTAAPTFSEKAALVPSCEFVVGADTLLRIADPCYYGNDAAQRDRAIRQIKDANCKFLVFGRELAGKFCSLKDLELPAELLRLCNEVPESGFREDVSSTELRKNP